MIFLLLFILPLSFIIYTEYKKKSNFKNLKIEIENVIKNIDDIKNKIEELPPELEEIYNTRVLILNKENVNQKTKTNMIYIYNVLLEQQKITNNIKKSISDIHRSKKDIENYLQDKYNISELYLKNEINKIFDEYKIDDIKTSDYDRKLMFKLIGIEKVINNKIKYLLDKSVKIGNIITDKENIKKTIFELKKSYNSYLIKKDEILNKNYINMTDSEFNNNIIEIENTINKSFEELKIDLNSALSYYNRYVTNLSILKGAFKKMNDLYDKDQQNRDF
jgi:hypothetical protein